MCRTGKERAARLDALPCNASHARWHNIKSRRKNVSVQNRSKAKQTKKKVKKTGMEKARLYIQL